jgi:hypothetical protein
MADGPVCGVGLYRLSLQGALREVSFVLRVICYVRISFPTLMAIGWATVASLLLLALTTLPHQLCWCCSGAALMLLCCGAAGAAGAGAILIN